MIVYLDYFFYRLKNEIKNFVSEKSFYFSSSCKTTSYSLVLEINKCVDRFFFVGEIHF